MEDIFSNKPVPEELKVKDRINSRKKGSKNEKKTFDYLTKKGYIVYTAPFVMYLKNRDIFNLFDHVATNYEEVLFVQTKTNRIRKEDLLAIQNFRLPYPEVKKVIFVWKDRMKEPLILYPV